MPTDKGRMANTVAWLSAAVAILTLISIVLGAGMYIGRLASRIESLEKEGRYLHGSITLPKE